MKPLTREEVKNVIEGKGRAKRIPLMYDFWLSSNVFDADLEKRNKWLEKYPCDMDTMFMEMPGLTEGNKLDPDYFWSAPGKTVQEGIGLDAQCVIDDWEEDGEAFFNSFPSAESPAMLPREYQRDERYLLGGWWYCFFERLWSLRGMENALTDFYLYPEYVHRLFDKLTDFYIRGMERSKEKWDVDGFFVSDDIGTQTSTFFSLEIFREFFKPYYKRLFDKAHELGCHFWLHTCGNIELFLPEFVEIGLDVIHPIQKNTMDEMKIGAEFSKDICIWAGVDVQYLIPFGTPDEVREEIDYLRKAFERPEGRLMFTMGNGSTPDWKIENLEALYEASMLPYSEDIK